MLYRIFSHFLSNIGFVINMLIINYWLIVYKEKKHLLKRDVNLMDLIDRELKLVILRDR